MSALEPRSLLKALFDAAVEAADPARLLPGRLPPPPPGRTVVVGAGKAAAAMARAVESEAARSWGPRADDLEGLVVTRDAHGVPCERIEVVEAAHPVPDARGRAAPPRILALARGLTADDLLIGLFSGGGSSLLALPAPGVSLADKQAVTTALLHCGAAIGEINCVRKHLSAVKGGRLATAARPARTVTFLISDVPGDDPAVVASGPTVPDSTTCADALDVLQRYGIERPASVLDLLQAGARRAASSEDPGGGDRSPFDDRLEILATAADGQAAAARAARGRGVQPVLLGHDLEGEARDLGGLHAALSLGCRGSSEMRLSALRKAVALGAAHLGRPALAVPAPPLVLLSGGETTVTVVGGGRGGRNTEYALGLAAALDGHPGIWALAADTDGIDGSEDNAGAFVDPGTLERARGVGVRPIDALAANDSYGLFSTLGDLLMTGPTCTNINDFRAVLVLDDRDRRGRCGR